MVRTLYICYFGLREPLVQTQVLPYLRELSRRGVEVHLLTFEPNKSKSWNDEVEARTRADLESHGIRWVALPYHKRPSLPATFYDVLAGAWAIRNISKHHSIDVLHARSHVPLAMALLAQRKERVIFDIRGLLAEEYAEAGVWKENGLPFRLTKFLERNGMKRADHLVVLTERVRDWLIGEGVAGDKITIIPCCVDLSRYDRRCDQAGNEPNGMEVIYAGSVTGLYLLDEMAKFFIEIRRRDDRAKLRVLTKTSREEVAKVFHRLGIEDELFEVAYVEPERLPSYLCRASLGLSFIKPTFSKIASSPTKIAEYLAAGIPVVSNGGVGDVDSLLKRERVGVILEDFNERERAKAADQLIELLRDPDLKERCKRTAHRYFDLSSVGGERYFAIYRALSAHQPGEKELCSFNVGPTDRQR